MNEFLFGLGAGWLPKSAGTIARQHGAKLANHTSAQCTCGYGCPIDTCKASRRHWFAGPNRGEPFNRQLSAAVMADIDAQRAARADSHPK